MRGKGLFPNLITLYTPRANMLHSAEGEGRVDFSSVQKTALSDGGIELTGLGGRSKRTDSV